jgi:hypothetical protein
MSDRNTVVRSLHDLGLAAWFGGPPAGAVGFNGAAADLPDPKLRLRVANAQSQGRPERCVFLPTCDSSCSAYRIFRSRVAGPVGLASETDSLWRAWSSGLAAASTGTRSSPTVGSVLGAPRR